MRVISVLVLTSQKKDDLHATGTIISAGIGTAKVSSTGVSSTGVSSIGVSSIGVSSIKVSHDGVFGRLVTLGL